MKFQVKGNENYAAHIVKIDNKIELPGMRTLCATTIFGQNVLINKNTEIGTLGIFFPIECLIDKEFLSKNNLFKHSDLNEDKTKTGFFEDSQRVKCLSFQGNKSEGFFIPIEALSYLGNTNGLEDGITFDTIDGKMICKKYIVNKKEIQNKTSEGSKAKKAKKKAEKFDRMIPGQFKFHGDTGNAAYHFFKFQPEQIIGISNKIHGSSFIVANTLTKRPMTWFEKFLNKWLKVKIDDKVYDHIAASRTVIKNKNINQESGSGFYNFDIWTDIKERIKHLIPPGYTVYGEVFGYLPTGGMIQKGYHYGCNKQEYRIIIYRVTITNAEGLTFELSEPQIQEFCRERDLPAKEMFYYGKAKDLFPELALDDNWSENFYNKMRSSFNLEQMCPLNNNEVPAEGVVLRIDRSSSFDAFKVKSFLFNKRETQMLDKGEVDIESEESVKEENEDINE